MVLSPRTVGAVPVADEKGGAQHPMVILDAGAGTGGIAMLKPGSTDRSGVVVVGVGSSPQSDIGIFTLHFGRARIRGTVCVQQEWPYGVQELFRMDTWGFVVYVHHQALQAYTAYTWSYDTDPMCAFKRTLKP